MDMHPDIKKVWEANLELRRLKAHGHRSEHVITPRGINEVRRLVAEVYLQRGFFNTSDIDDDGTLKPQVDAYRDRAQYFCVRDDAGEIIMTSRLIEPDANGIDSLQTVISELDPRWAEHLRSQDVSTIREISALVKKPELSSQAGTGASLCLFKEMFAYCHANGIKSLIFSTNPRLGKNYEKLFGDSLQRMGEVSHIKLGSYSDSRVPYLLDLNKYYEYAEKKTLFALGKKAVARFITSGIEKD